MRFLDKDVGFTKNAAVKKEGLWYYPINRTGPNTVSAPAVFYQNANSFLVDMIWFADFGTNRFFAVRGYNYREVEKRGVRLPARIEIFEADAEGALHRRLVKIDFK